MSVQPIVIAHHLIMTGYGMWPPNDPRGSMSDAIESQLLAALGPAHLGRKRVQPAWRDVDAFRRDAADVMCYPPMLFGDDEIKAIAAAFTDAIADKKYTCYACAIMPDHVHILIRKHKHAAEEMIEHLQSVSRSRLSAAQLRTTDHPVWARGGWKVFLDHPDDVARTIAYINRNPKQMRLPDQHWPFVLAYDGWPLHPGHSPNSPYARRLRAAGRYRPPPTP